MGLMGEASKKAHLLCWSAGNNHLRRSQQTVFEPITAAGLAQDHAFGNLIARLMRNRFVQVWIEGLSLCFDGLQSVFGQEIAELFQYDSHPGINGRLFAFPFRGYQTEL